MYKRGKIYYERFKYPDGSAKRICLETEDPVLAEKVKAKITTNIIMDKHFDTKRLAKKRTVRQMATEIFDLQAGDYCGETLKTYTFIFKVICDHFGDLMLDEVAPEMLDKYKAGEQKRGLKDDTINTRLRFLKRYWELARNKYMWTANDPFENVATPRSDSERIRYLTDEEREKLLNAFSDKRYLWLRDYFVVACDTGLRRKNMCNMTWKNVDFKNQTLNFTPLEMKNNKSHTMLMTEHVYNVLSQRMASYGNKGTVFRNSFGDPINKEVLSTNFTILTKKFGVPDFHVHDMRHDFCSQLAMNGAELYDIMGMAGHSDIKQTLRYVHLMPARKRKAVDILNKRAGNKLRAVN
jgi:integrase